MTQLSIRDRIMSRQMPEERGQPDPIAPLSHPEVSTRKRWRLAAAIGAFALVTGTGVAIYQYPELSAFLTGDTSAQSSQDPATTGSTEPDTPFQRHVAQAGIQSCAHLFPALGQVLTLGSSYAVNTQWDSAAPNSHPVQAVAGMTYDMADYKGQAAGVVFASPVGDGCEGNLVRVAPFPKPCQEVAKTLPEGSTLAETLAGTPLYNLAKSAGQALLVSTGNSCVVVSVAQMAG